MITFTSGKFPVLLAGNRFTVLIRVELKLNKKHNIFTKYLFFLKQTVEN